MIKVWQHLVLVGPMPQAAFQMESCIRHEAYRNYGRIVRSGSYRAIWSSPRTPPKRLELDEVVFVPAAIPPHKRHLSQADANIG